MSTEYLRGFGTVSLDEEKTELLSDGRLSITFLVKSSDPQALDIVSKTGAAMAGVSYTCKSRGNSTVTLWARVHEPQLFNSNHPFIKDFFQTLKSKINGSDRTRARRNGMIII